MSEFKLEFEPRGDTEIVMTRKFRAPRELVFRAYTDPVMVKKWMCPPCGESTMLVIDTSIGGVWRHKIDMGEHGTFDSFGQTLEFDAPNRIVRSDVVNIPGARENIATETTTFSEEEGVTTLQLVVRHLSKEIRDENIAFAEGSCSAYDALEMVLEEVQNAGV